MAFQKHSAPAKIYKLKVKKGDTVQIIAGDFKGTKGTVLATVPKQNGVLIDGLNVLKRHIKPNKLNPRGGTKDIHVPINASKVKLVAKAKAPAKKDAKKTKGGKK
jgi:large subunit ribosomal protein L24